MTKEEEEGVQIRLAKPNDAVAIASLLYKSFVEYERQYTPKGFAVTVSTPDQIRDRMSEGPIWVALNNDVIVGTVSAVLKDQALYIRGMAVDPAARGNRIGRQLLECAQEFALQRECACLFLCTTPFLSRAIKLYEDYGFVRTDESPGDLFGTPIFGMDKAL